jgi:hypothetical protein
MDKVRETLEKIYDLMNDGTHAVRINGNTLEVYGITQEMIKITVDVK